MSRSLPNPSGFALYLHGNICHGPKSWYRGSPQVCCRRLVVGSLLLRLVPLVGTPNEDASKIREGGGSLALGGCRWVVRHNNQPMLAAAIGGMMERMRGRGGVYGGGVFLILGRRIERQKKLQK